MSRPTSLPQDNPSFWIPAAAGMTTSILFILGILICILFTFSTATLAQNNSSEDDSPAIVLISMSSCCADHAWLDAEAQVAYEFSLSDMAIQTIEEKTFNISHREAELAELATQHRATVAMRIVNVDGETGAEFWINHPLSGNPKYRYLSLSKSTNEESATIAAMKIFEYTRTLLAALQKEKTASADSAAPPSKATSLSKQKEPSPPAESTPTTSSINYRLFLGAGIFFFPHDMPTQLGPAFGIGLGFGRLHSLQVNGVLGRFGKDYRYDAYAAEFNIDQFTLQWKLAFFPTRAIHPGINISAGISRVELNGIALDPPPNNPTPLVAVHTQMVSATLGLGLFVLAKIYRDWHLYAAVDVTANTPKTVIVMEDNRTARFGIPVFCGTVGVSFIFSGTRDNENK